MNTEEKLRFAELMYSDKHIQTLALEGNDDAKIAVILREELSDLSNRTSEKVNSYINTLCNLMPDL